MIEKIRIDMAAITGRDMIAADELLPEGVKLGFALAEQDFRAFYALATVMVRRTTNPDFTYDQALDLPFSALDVVNTEDDVPGEVFAASNGGAPQSSLAAGS